MARRPAQTNGRKVKWISAAKRRSVEADYDVTARVLGTGMFSIVRLAVEKNTGQKWALKVLEKDENDVMAVRNEVRLLRKVKNSYITALHDVYETPSAVVLVLELMEGGELFRTPKRIFTEVEAARLIRQILLALQYLHSLGVVHRDVKPENILYLSGSEDALDVKLADFGIAKLIGENDAKTPCGTPAFVAPEIARADAYNKAIDMWALGCTLYTLLCGFAPFYDEDMARMYELIKAGKYSFPSPAWDNISDTAKDLVSSLLRVEPSTRLTAEDALKHPWVLGSKPTQTLPLRTPPVSSGHHKSPGWKAALDVSIDYHRDPQRQPDPAHVKDSALMPPPPPRDERATTSKRRTKNKKTSSKSDDSHSSGGGSNAVD